MPVEVADKLVRHFNAAHIAGYVGLNAIGMGSPYSKTFFFDHYNEENNLLTPREMMILSHHDMDSSGLCMKELVTWCQQDVAQARKDGHIDSYQEKFMHSKILDFRAAMDGMYDYTDQPPHFFYIHFLVLLSALYLPLFAIDTAFAAGWGANGGKAIGLDILQGIIVFLQCIFVVGLRSLGTKMIDPYGDDLEDLSVINYVEGTLEICRTIMGAKQPVKGVPSATTGLL
jgi:predicted membrane chloride channel (bestrophin family)